MTISMSRCLALIVPCSLLLMSPTFLPTVSSQLVEEERVKQYHNRNYTWPIVDFVPNTTGWRNLWTDRLAQISELKDRGSRYEGYYQAVYTSKSVPNYTEHGFGLAKCPDELLAALQQGIYDGLATAGEEARDGVIPGPHAPWFISRPDLNLRVLNELHSFAEEWVGIPLTAVQAYGFRLYRNESQLFMHIDRIQTHVISFVLHVDSSEDAEDWPIFIEDFHGNTHEVVLTPGDIFFYESSKCLHGRPTKFNGSWYTSIFVHYYPKEGWNEVDREVEAHYAIPPSWANDPPVGEPTQPKLEMIETSFTEPECPHSWCRTQNTIRWSGPAVHGYLTRPTQERVPFHPRLVMDKEYRIDEL
jgi:hypothetical protein